LTCKIQKTAKEIEQLGFPLQGPIVQELQGYAGYGTQKRMSYEV
jgi:hypothetical protein